MSGLVSELLLLSLVPAPVSPSLKIKVCWCVCVYEAGRSGRGSTELRGLRAQSVRVRL